MKRQPQFETDSDRDKIIERDFNKLCLKLAGVIAFAFLLLLLIGYTGAHGAEIDQAVDKLLH